MTAQRGEKQPRAFELCLKKRNSGLPAAYCESPNSNPRTLIGALSATTATIGFILGTSCDTLKGETIINT